MAEYIDRKARKMENDYIKREDLIRFNEQTLKHIDDGTAYHALDAWIDNAHAADVAPIAHAHWINDGIIHCSRCNAYLEKDEMKNHTMKYCYYCGARMDESEGDGE